MTYEKLLEEFGAKFGIDGLADEGGAAALVIDDTKVDLIHDADAGCVVIYAEIGYPPPEANGKFGEIMLKANHLYLGTNGGTLCQNPETDAYVLMRPVPLAPLEGADTFGAIMEDVLLQVDNWRELLNGLRVAEVEEEAQTKEDGRLASGGFLQE